MGHQMSLLTLFRRREPIDPEIKDWIVETVTWLLRNLGGHDEFRQTVIVTPTNDFFPPKDLSGHSMAHHVLECTKSLARIQDWPCELEQQDDDLPDSIALTTPIVHAQSSPSGTFSIGPDGRNIPIISYHPKLLKDPQALVATFAHELAHYITATIEEPPPGGWENTEPATDITAVFLGFGIFLANSAFGFSQFGDVLSQGWSWQRQGYLPETELLYGHALISVLLKADPEITTAHLKPSLVRPFKKFTTLLAESDEPILSLRRLDNVSPTTPS